LGQLQQLRPARQRARSRRRPDVRPPTLSTITLPYSASILTTRSLAAAFTSCANSLVSDIILPIISLLPFLSRNLDEKFAILQRGPSYNSTISTGYNTVKQALDDGAVVFAWGNFIDKVIRFMCIALALWIIALAYSRGTDDNIVKKQVKCKFCRKYISEKAKRCVNCTSWVDGRESQ
jgi:large conductance mechanosensitive channel